MKSQFSEELFLTNETGRRLYHKYAEPLPIIDYHCHLLPQEIHYDSSLKPTLTYYGIQVSIGSDDYL